MRSKKPSATSPEPPELLTFFVDRSLGRLAGQLLRDQAGANVVLHDDLFQPDALDVDWLREVGSKGWVVLTKDKRIRYRPLERQAVLAANLRVFVLAVSKGLTGEQIGRTLVKNIHRIERLARKEKPPFIAGVYANEVRRYSLPGSA